MWSRQRTRQSSADLAIDVPIDVYAPDHSAIAQPLQPAWDWSENARAQQSGLYSNLRLQLAEPLHLTLGGRLSWGKYQSNDGFTGAKSRDYEQKHEFTPRRATTSQHPVRCSIAPSAPTTRWA
ncbi:hypothetical protein G6F59_016333 [Rhizopus arrhizus]|nr:hypothetical protein G6F59_016333 [Rhizopus arrhizus]